MCIYLIDLPCSIPETSTNCKPTLLQKCNFFPLSCSFISLGIVYIFEIYNFNGNINFITISPIYLTIHQFLTFLKIYFNYSDLPY